MAFPRLAFRIYPTRRRGSQTRFPIASGLYWVILSASDFREGVAHAPRGRHSSSSIPQASVVARGRRTGRRPPAIGLRGRDPWRGEASQALVSRQRVRTRKVQLVGRPLMRLLGGRNRVVRQGASAAAHPRARAREEARGIAAGCRVLGGSVRHGSARRTHGRAGGGVLRLAGRRDGDIPV